MLPAEVRNKQDKAKVWSTASGILKNIEHEAADFRVVESRIHWDSWGTYHWDPESRQLSLHEFESNGTTMPLKGKLAPEQAEQAKS